MRLRLILSVLLLGGCADFATLEKRYRERDVEEKIGVLAHLEINWPKSTAAFARALDFYRSEEVDAVVVIGDPTQNGYANQLKVFEDAFQAAFRDGKAPRLIRAEDPYEYGGIRFTDQGRYPLTDLLCAQPLTGKQINVGSMHGIEISKIFQLQDKRTLAQMRESAQGLLVLRRAEGLTVRRLDFSGAIAEDVGSPWEVDATGLIRDSAAERAPEFWDDTTISVVRGYDKVGEVIYTVRWPPVLAKHTGARAFNYDVLVGKKIIRRVQSRAFYLPESRETSAVLTVVYEKELNGAAPRFGVRPISSLGLAGRTVWSE